LAGLALAGCAAASPGPAADPFAAPASLAAPGQCLDTLGVTTAPAGHVCLPPGVTLTEVYGAERTLLVLGPSADGPTVLDYLVATLPGLGWTVTAASDTAVRFEAGEWQGSFALGDGTWGLTVRAE
jgi:hypothetical protein